MHVTRLVNSDAALVWLKVPRRIPYHVMCEIVQDFEGNHETRLANVFVPLQKVSVDNLDDAAAEVALKARSLPLCKSGTNLHDAVLQLRVYVRLALLDVVENVLGKCTGATAQLVEHQVVLREQVQLVLCHKVPSQRPPIVRLEELRGGVPYLTGGHGIHLVLLHARVALHLEKTALFPCDVKTLGSAPSHLTLALLERLELLLHAGFVFVATNSSACLAGFL